MSINLAGLWTLYCLFKGKNIGQPNATDSRSSFLNGVLKEKQLNLATFGKPAVSIGEIITSENNHSTIQPSSNDRTTQQLSTHISNEEEFKVPDLKYSSSSTTKNIPKATPPEPRKENLKEPAFPEFTPTRNKSHLLGSSESSDDVDALSLKKSLLNIGNKTGLMDFATPQNKSSGQIVATRTDSKYFM